MDDVRKSKLAQTVDDFTKEAHDSQREWYRKELICLRERIVEIERWFPELGRLDAPAGRFGESLEELRLLFFYIKNLSHKAWTDPKNAQPLFERIEAYAIKGEELASPRPASQQEEGGIYIDHDD